MLASPCVAALLLHLEFLGLLLKIKAAQARCFNKLSKSLVYWAEAVVLPSGDDANAVVHAVHAVHAVILRGCGKVDAIFSIINADCSIIRHSAPCSMVFRLCHLRHEELWHG